MATNQTTSSATQTDGLSIPAASVPRFAVRLPGREGVVARVMAATLDQRFIAILLTIFIAKGILLTYIHPPFSGHDEVGHYAYLEFVAVEHRLPLIPDLGEWQETYQTTNKMSHDKLPAELWKWCAYTTKDWQPGCAGENVSANAVYGANGIRGGAFPTGWVYTANHPPLYYMILTPVYWLTDGFSIETQLYTFRLVSMLMGALVVLFAYLTVATLFPRDRFLKFLVPTFVAFQPQIAYESAMLNNDILAILFTSVVIYLLVRGLKTRFPLGNTALIGLFFGLAALSKNTSLSVAAVIAFAMIFGLGIRNWKAWLNAGIFTGAVSAALIFPWFLYMYQQYGDFTGLGRVKELQYWNFQNSDPPTIWDQLNSQGFVWSRWSETWGAFGWRLINLDWELLELLLQVAIVATIGIGVWAVRFWWAQRPIIQENDPEVSAGLRARLEGPFDLEYWQVVGILMMGVTCIISYFAILQFGTTFSLTQARYYFPAIVPAAILFVLGIRALVPRVALPYVQGGLFTGLVLLNVLIYTQYVIPFWASRGHTYINLDPIFR